MKETHDFILLTAPCRKEWQNSYPPLGIASLGAMLEARGYNVKLLDGSCLNNEQIKNFLIQHEAKVIGVSCPTTEQRIDAIKVVRLAKKIQPKAKLIVGGLHYSIFPEHVFKLSPVDIVVIGEGELTIIELAEAVIKNTKDISSIKGIAYKKNRKIVRTEPRPFIEDLDILPFPKYDDFDMDIYFKNLSYKEGVEKVRNLKPGRIMVSRGCPFSCLYCSTCRYWGRKIRYKSVKRNIEEIKHLQSKYGVEWLIYSDDNLTFDKKRTIELCKAMIDEKIKVTWMADSRVNGIDYETLKWMKKAGCYAVIYGVETGSPKMLKNIKKAQTVEQIEHAFKITRKAGLIPMGFLMIGNPGETFHTVYETYKMWKKIQKPEEGIGAVLTWIYPNSELYDLAKQKGIINDKFWLTDQPVPYYTGDHSLFVLKNMRLFLYFLWFQHVLVAGNLRTKLDYIKKAFRWFISNIKYSIREKEFKTQL